MKGKSLKVLCEYNYYRAPFLNATTFANGLKTKFEETIFTKVLWLGSCSQTSIFVQKHYRAFSISVQYENSVWPINVRL